MFKFIRKYQKWMLVVFCGGLMVAFIIPQAASQFAPTGKNKVIAKIYDGQKITEGDRQQAISNIILLRQLGFPGVGLYPQEDNESDQALAWLLMVRAGQHAGFTASDSEAFTALSMRQAEVDSTDALDAFAAEKNIARAALLGVVKEYLIAEQYRQLVQGASYQIHEGYTGSPGLYHVRREAEVLSMVGNPQFQQQLMLDFYTQSGRVPNTNEMQMLSATFVYNQLSGRPRISDNATRQAIHAQQTLLSGTLVVFDAEPSTLAPTEEQLQDLFERYRGDFAGRGETYGFGYRQSGRVRLEALRVPMDQALALAAEKVTEADVRRYFDDNALLYADWTPRDAEPEEAADDGASGTDSPGEGDAEAGDDGEALPAEGDATGDAEGTGDSAPDAGEPDTEVEPEVETPAVPTVGERVRIDFRLRREIRQVLNLQGANAIMGDVVRDLNRILNEDARVLDEHDGFKVIPPDFVPTPLAEAARRIQEDHGIMLEVIEDNGEWVSLPDFTQTMRFVGGMAGWMPTTSVWLPGQGGFALQEQQLPAVSLSGRLGLLSSMTPQQTSLQRYVSAVKELQPEGPAAGPGQPQVGLAIQGATFDVSGSVYITRLTAAERDRPGDSLADVRAQVIEDAQQLAGYEALLDRKDGLLQRARENTIYDITALGTEHKLDDFSRSRLPAVEGLPSAGTRELVEAAFELANRLRADGAGVEGSPSSERVVAVELPGERKLLVFVLNAYRPVSQPTYQAMVNAPQGDLVTRIALQRAIPEGANPIQALQETLTLEAMIRHTGFEYAEGQGPSNEGASDGDVDDDSDA